MKVTKKNIILEAVENAAEVVDKLDEKPVATVDLATASTDEIVADMVQGAADTNAAVDMEKVEAEAEVVKNVRQFIRNPYGTARPSKIERILQRSLDTALDDREAGLQGNYQNVIIYGLAGFGKTSVVEKFCKDHGLNMFECDAKNLDPATVGGIPYPISKNSGEITQAPISSEYWGGLEEENTVLFLDEINRANGRTRGSLLTLINNHKLPAAVKDNKTGRYSASKFFPNILFSVIAINPADDVFEDNEPLDPAMISRNSVVVEQKADKKEFLKHLTEVYEAIAGCPALRQELQDKYAGQYEIAKTLLNNTNFNFDDADTVRTTYLNQGKKMENYLNYRTFLLTLLRSNGKKQDYLDIINDESGFIDTDKKMIANCLAAYKDKITTGNSVFSNGPQTSAQKAAARDAAEALQSFADAL